MGKLMDSQKGWKIYTRSKEDDKLFEKTTYSDPEVAVFRLKGLENNTVMVINHIGTGFRVTINNGSRSLVVYP